MARPIEFDRDTVLELGMLQFWRYGFEATAVSTITDVCGVGRGTLYNSFGDKEAFFTLCLQRYVDKLQDRLEMTLGNSHFMARPALEGFFMDVVEHAAHHRGPWTKHGLGCLLANCMNDGVFWNPRLHKFLKDTLAPVRKALRQRVHEIARPRGFVLRHQVDGTTDQLMALYFGLCTQARMGKPAKHLKLVAMRALHRVTI